MLPFRTLALQGEEHVSGLGYATFSSVTVRPESWALLAKYRGLAQAHRREARRLKASRLAVAA
jgi:hypothetical protein